MEATRTAAAGESVSAEVAVQAGEEADRRQSEALCVEFAAIDASTIEQVKALNRAIFPVKYQDAVYQQCAQAGPVTQLAFFGQSLIGAIACRLEAQQCGSAKLYIMTLGVLAPFRNMGIGTRLLQHSLAQAQCDPNILSAYLHVHVSNEEAIRFYARHGFAVGPVIPKYYRRIEPPDAVLLSKALR